VIACDMKMASPGSAVSATGSGVSESGESMTVIVTQPAKLRCWCPSRSSQTRHAIGVMDWPGVGGEGGGKEKEKMEHWTDVPGGVAGDCG
jgi:hypothetical protein